MMITIEIMNLVMVEIKLQKKQVFFCSHVDTKPRDGLFVAATTSRTRARAPLRNKCDKNLHTTGTKAPFCVLVLKGKGADETRYMGLVNFYGRVSVTIRRA